MEASGERYTLLIERHLVGILFFVIVKDTLLTNITDLRAVTTGRIILIRLLTTYSFIHSLTRTGIGIFGMMGNKGGISIRFNLHETSICFVCAHLRAQQKAVDGRVLIHSLIHLLTHSSTHSCTQNEDVRMILEKTVLPPNERADMPIHGGPSRQWLSLDHHRETIILDHDIVFW